MANINDNFRTTACFSPVSDCICLCICTRESTPAHDRYYALREYSISEMSFRSNIDDEIVLSFFELSDISKSHSISGDIHLAKRINENIILHTIENEASHFNSNGKEVIDRYKLAFGFYDCLFYLVVTKENLQKNLAFNASFGSEILIDSFDHACSTYLWEHIKEACNSYENKCKEAQERINKILERERNRTNE